MPQKLGRAAALISLATMLSRVLGLVREQLFAALMGASALADAFNVAFRIPNLLRDLFAEGALSQAFVPTFKAAFKNDGPDRAYLLANRVAGTLFVVIGVVILFAGIGAASIVNILAGEYAAESGKFELTVTLTRVMLPFLPIISLAAVAMGMLNAQEQYRAPALAPATFNLVSIAVGSAIYVGGVEGHWIAIGWSVGTVLGGIAQLSIQLPSLHRLGFRPRPRIDLGMRDPGVRRIGKLMLPAIGGLAAVQVNIIVNTFFASQEPGAVSWLNYAFRFLQLPIGVFGVAIATVSTTRYADAAADSDTETLRDHFTGGLRLVLLLTVPATIGLVLLDLPIIRLIFEHGRFSDDDTFAVARALELYAIGLVAYSAVKVAAPAYYALDRARVPVLASVLAVGVNLTISVTLHDSYGYQILAFGIACAALVNFSVLYLWFHFRVAPMPHVALLGFASKVLLAGGGMGALVYTANRYLDDTVFGERGGTLVDATETFVPVLVGVVAYGVLAKLLRIREIDQYLLRLRRTRK